MSLSMDQHSMGADGSILSWRQYATITTLKWTWKLRLTIRDNTQLGFFCRRIVAVVNSNVVILGSAHYRCWWFSTVMATVCDNNSIETYRDITVDNTRQYTAALLLFSYCHQHSMGTVRSLLSWRQHAKITTVKLRGKLRLTIRGTTELGFYCHRIVAIVKSMAAAAKFIWGDRLHVPRNVSPCPHEISQELARMNYGTLFMITPTKLIEVYGQYGNWWYRQYDNNRSPAVYCRVLSTVISLSISMSLLSHTVAMTVNNHQHPYCADPSTKTPGLTIATIRRQQKPSCVLSTFYNKTQFLLWIMKNDWSLIIKYLWFVNFNVHGQKIIKLRKNSSFNWFTPFYVLIRPNVIWKWLSRPLYHVYFTVIHTISRHKSFSPRFGPPPKLQREIHPNPGYFSKPAPLFVRPWFL